MKPLLANSYRWSMKSYLSSTFRLRPWFWANSWQVDLVLSARVGLSEELFLILILVLDVFPQLLHFQDKNHKLLALSPTFCSYSHCPGL